jgi:uncharacterized membrane protein affecting hemolysin expression
MRIELDDNSSITLVIALLVALLTVVTFNARACSQAQNRETTERCKALIEARADQVSINSTCGRQPQ